ncbi:MAG: epoxyqueuosine reductase QueH [Clostridia bacterium]|nr:epoxyqueuosine reductase QueH [Clostridia bacterium]MBP3652768.1 epoxyqueuosine reductase QueH [Clostridia bacterium]
MTKINYNLEMEKEIVRLQREERRPVLVLHSCCAPCSSAVLERLHEVFELVVFYYNPNISPEAEFRHRAEEQKRLVEEMPLRGDARVVEGEYDPQRFYELVRGHEEDPEGGERCGICFEMRLRKTAEYARSIGAEYFTTTLSISPLKNARRLNELGRAIAGEFGLNYLLSDFKKKDGYRRSCVLSEEHGLYRQDFCGCVFSKMERERARTEAD